MPPAVLRFAFLVPCFAFVALAAAPAPSVSPDRCLYLPPALADRVVYYHSFDGGLDRPQINRLGAKVSVAGGAAAPGIAGQGCFFAGTAARQGLHLADVALPLHRPLTAMMWWKLETPMKQDSGFHLASLRGRGYVSNFVRSGPWCGLKEPKCVLQVWNWPGISNVNHIDFRESAWIEPGTWHHVALVVTKGSNARVYWDGACRADVDLKGRLFSAEDTAASIAFGPEGQGLAMTVDEVVILDAALDADAVRDYLGAVRQLAAAGFSVLSPGGM